MASSPKLKIFNPCGEYVASCKFGEDAAMIVAGYGDGATIRDGHRKQDIVWNEGAEEFNASESYDGVASLIAERIAARYSR